MRLYPCSWIRIRIHIPNFNLDPDQVKPMRIHSDPDPQQGCIHYNLSSVFNKQATPESRKHKTELKCILFWLRGIWPREGAMPHELSCSISGVICWRIECGPFNLALKETAAGMEDKNRYLKSKFQEIFYPKISTALMLQYDVTVEWPTFECHCWVPLTYCTNSAQEIKKNS
jgi:hypothetical protein